jgi:hypothetical protein
MKSVYNFVVTPKGKRYNNTKKIGDSELILNTEIQHHQYINREAIIVSTPIIGDTELNKGDTVIVHHNVFRRWHNMKGIEKNSRSWFNEDNYILSSDQIFLYKTKNTWKPLHGYVFIKPIENNNKYSSSKEKRCVGIIKYSNSNFKVNDLVGFEPGIEYEFIIDNERLYRIHSKFITIKYEYQGDEKEYNPSWA